MFRLKFAMCLALFAGLLLGTSACSSRSQRSVELQTAHEMLDGRQYEMAVSYLSDLLNKNPQNSEFAALLADAHMGAAGFELLPAINAVMGLQKSAPLGLYQEPECTRAAIKSLTDLNYKCLLYRIMQRIPVADDPHWLAAQTLLRRYFPDPDQTAMNTNFVAGLVELVSALGRVRILYDAALVQRMDYGLRVDPTQFPYDPVIHHAKRAITEINQGLARFRRSYSKFWDLIHGFEGKNILSIGERSLVFDGMIRTSDILRFLADVAQDHTVPIDEYLSGVVTDQLHELNAGFVEVIEANTPAGMTPMQFGAYVKGVLGGLAEQIDKDVKITFAQLLWANPPPIVRSLLEAAEQAWDQETGAPLLAYFAATRPEWLELKEIARGWDVWLNQDMAPETKQAVLAKFTVDARAHSEKLSYPAIFAPEALRVWSSNVGGFVNYEINGLPVDITVCLTPNPPASCALLPPGTLPTGGGLPPLPPLPDPSALLPVSYLEAQRLLSWTDAWMTRNFYPMAEWMEFH